MKIPPSYTHLSSAEQELIISVIHSYSYQKDDAYKAEFEDFFISLFNQQPTSQLEENAWYWLNHVSSKHMRSGTSFSAIEMLAKHVFDQTKNHYLLVLAAEKVNKSAFDPRYSKRIKIDLPKQIYNIFHSKNTQKFLHISSVFLLYHIGICAIKYNENNHFFLVSRIFHKKFIENSSFLFASGLAIVCAASQIRQLSFFSRYSLINRSLMHIQQVASTCWEALGNISFFTMMSQKIANYFRKIYINNEKKYCEAHFYKARQVWEQCIHMHASLPIPGL